MSYKSGELFLTLNDAVKVAVLQFDVDPIIARQEFEQKCFVPCTDYEMGYYDGLAKARDAITDVMEYGFEYARATDQMEHDIAYEPTYDSEDGSM